MLFWLARFRQRRSNDWRRPSMRPDSQIPLVKIIITGLSGVYFQLPTLMYKKIVSPITSTAFFLIILNALLFLLSSSRGKTNRNFGVDRILHGIMTGHIYIYFSCFWQVRDKSKSLLLLWLPFWTWRQYISVLVLQPLFFYSNISWK